MAPSRLGLLSIVLCLTLKGTQSINPGGFPNSLGRTPYRGWNTWNAFREDPSYDASTVLRMLDGLTSPITGTDQTTLRSSGYSFIALDEGWAACGSGVNGSYHDAAGRPIVNTTRLPNLQELVSVANARNVSMWWYLNCCGCDAEFKLSRPHYVEDIQALASLGFAGVKIDSCGNAPNISAWAAALYDTGKQIMLENCNDDHPFRATETDCPFNSFRTSSDLAPYHATTLSNAWENAAFLSVARPGCFPMADMLTIGTPAWDAATGSYPNVGCNGTRLTDAEARAQFALWAVMSSPLVLGFDVSNATERSTWGPIVTHPTALAIHEAWAGEAGRVVSQSMTNWSGVIPIGCYCEATRPVSLPIWGVFGKKLSTDTFAAVMVTGGWVGPVNFSAPVSAMGFPAGATLSSVDVWTGNDTGDVVGSWSGTEVSAPGGAFRIFTLKGGRNV